MSDEEDESGHLRIAGGHYTVRVGRDPYADPFMLDAAARLIAAVCGRFGSHPAVYAWNLANEPDLFYVPKSYADSARWNARMAAEVARYSSRPVTTGLHLPVINADNGFRIDQIAPHNAFMSMHAYSIFYPVTEASDPLNSDLVPLACLVAEALSGKRVLFEEFGYTSAARGEESYVATVRRGPTMGRHYFADDHAGGRYYTEVLEKLARCGALGAFAWMFSDYDPRLWTYPPYNTHEHERFFGLTRSDGTLKPSGRAMLSFAQRAVTGDLPTRTNQLPHIDPEDWYKDPAGQFERLFSEWRGRL